MVFSDASIASASNPSDTAFAKVLVASSSTFGTSSFETPFKPIEKVACLSSSERPPPMIAEPKPDSIIGL